MCRLLPLALLSILMISSCDSSYKKTRDNGIKDTQDYLLHSTVYAQSAAEYKSLCYQAYALARIRMKSILEEDQIERPAIILDLDETVLDNSPYTAWQIISGNPFQPETWSEWVEAANAESVPGAVDFLQWADSSGVEIYYISNRSIDGFGATIENLQKLNIPSADSSHIFLKTNTSDKSERRAEVKTQGVDVVLYIGDNLGDYSEIWDKPSTPSARLDSLSAYRQKIGKEFIVLPNSLYGTWEGAVYGYNRDLTDEQRDSLRRSVLNAWSGPE